MKFPDKEMQRVLLIGPCGAGKSTFGQWLGEATGLPVIHLDRLYWQAGWQATPKEVWQERVQALVAEERWIMDGNYGSTLDIRLPRADTVLVFDFPRWLYMYRATRRIIGSYGRSRSDMAEGCPEHFDSVFFRWMWDWPKKGRNIMLTALEQYANRARVIHLRSPRDVQAFKATLKEEREFSP